jgi:hypothetical protein
VLCYGFTTQVSSNSSTTSPTLHWLASAVFNDLSLTTVVGKDQMTGTFQGSGFTGTSITLNRQ